MARTALTPVTVTNQTITTVSGRVLTMEAGDNANGNGCPCTGKELIVVHNPSGGALWYKVTSVKDANGRNGDTGEVDLAAGATAILGPFPVSVWKDTTDGILINCESADLDFAAIRLP